jgi:sulfoxide reductase heme-binding subunit YedZ
VVRPERCSGRSWRGPVWLKKNRRYFGVAAFAYAAAHTVFYLIDKASLDRVLTELPRFYIWTGWVAFALFLPLALTSMDHFVRRMGPRWKQLQRLTYPAAALTLLHWAALHDWRHPTAALVHFAPLIGLEAYRIWYWYLRPRPATA